MFEVGDMVQVDFPGNPKDGHIGQITGISTETVVSLLFTDNEIGYYRTKHLFYPRQCMQKTLPDMKG